MVMIDSKKTVEKFKGSKSILKQLLGAVMEWVCSPISIKSGINSNITKIKLK